MLKDVSVRNFKSFAGLKLHLSPLTVLVGPNASGKTNFMDAFKFIQDCMKDGISIAVGHRLGRRGIRCWRRYDDLTELAITAEIRDPELGETFEYGGKRRFAQRSLKSFEYSFRFRHEKLGFVVTEERLRAVTYVREAGKTLEEEMGFERTVDQVQLKPPLPKGEAFPILKQMRDSLFLTSGPFISIATLMVFSYISRWRFFDLHPDETRMPRIEERTTNLSEHGENLALVLRALERVGNGANGELRQRVRDLMHSMVPGFDSWRTEQFPDGKIGFGVREQGFRSFFPPELVSDGTLLLLSLFAALLYHEGPPGVLFVEEPERGLHPQILGDLADLMRQVSTTSQVIATTHSPDLVRHLKPEEVFMVDKVDRATQILQASCVEQIEEFLRDFSIDELWLQGYLGRGLPI